MLSLKGFNFIYLHCWQRYVFLIISGCGLRLWSGFLTWHEVRSHLPSVFSHCTIIILNRNNVRGCKYWIFKKINLFILLHTVCGDLQNWYSWDREINHTNFQIDNKSLFILVWPIFYYSYLISGDADGKVYVWDWKTTKLYNKFKAHDDVCVGVLWHPHETSKVATCGWDGVIKYWDWGESRNTFFNVKVNSGFKEQMSSSSLLK